MLHTEQQSVLELHEVPLAPQVEPLLLAPPIVVGAVPVRVPSHS
jgi:hypothetical protein